MRANWFSKELLGMHVILFSNLLAKIRGLL